MQREPAPSLSHDHTPEHPAKLHLEIDWEFIPKEQTEESCFNHIDVLRQHPEYVERFNTFKQKAIKKKSFAQFVSEGKEIARSAQQIIGAFRQDNNQLYERNWNLILIHHLKANLPPSAVQTINTYVIGTLKYRSQEGSAKILTKYAMHMPYSEGDSMDAVLLKIMQRHIILLGHQDVTDIEATLSDAKIFFDQAMSWTHDRGIESLKDSVGCMMFLLAHSHRDTRGTAAESEWIEHAIYLAHNLLLSSEASRMPDLIAFSHFDIEEFLMEYKGSFTLTALSGG
jgi:hypothetical protein